MLLQLMCSWLCATGEGRLVLASPDLTYLDSIAACAVSYLVNEGEGPHASANLVSCMQQKLVLGALWPVLDVRQQLVCEFV